MPNFTPKPEDQFTFGLWTVGQIGRDPFGGPVRGLKTPAELVYLVGEVGAYGVNFHDNDTRKADALKAHSFDYVVLAGRGMHYERLDQLTIDLLLGAR